MRKKYFRKFGLGLLLVVGILNSVSVAWACLCDEPSEQVDAAVVPCCGETEAESSQQDGDKSADSSCEYFECELNDRGEKIVSVFRMNLATLAVAYNYGSGNTSSISSCNKAINNYAAKSSPSFLCVFIC